MTIIMIISAFQIDDGHDDHHLNFLLPN